MTVTMRSVTSSWPIAIGSTTRVAARPATLPDGSGAIAPGQYAIAAGRTLGIGWPLCSGARTLVDRRRDGSDERVIERFGAGSKREQITAIARDYLAQARRHGPRVRSAA